MQLGHLTLAALTGWAAPWGMSGWMLTEQADLFGLGMDALTAEEAAELVGAADRQPLSDDDFEESADLSQDVGPGPGPDTPEWWSCDDGAGLEPPFVPVARHYEFVCAGCFLIWHRRLLTDRRRRLCRDCAQAE